MSPRLTRSAAKHSANSPNTQASTSPTNQTEPPTGKKKRKNPPRESSEDPDNPATASSVRKSKRRRNESPEAESPNTITAASSLQGNAKAMATSKDPNEKTNENIISTPTAAGSSKKKPGKNKKVSSPEQTSSGPSSTKRSRPSGSKKQNAAPKKDNSPAKQKDSTAEVEDKSRRASEEDTKKSTPAHDDYDSLDDDPMAGSAFLGRRPAGFHETLRALSGFVPGSTQKLRDALETIKNKDDPSLQLIGLTEISEVLLISTEDNLAGQFSPEPYIKEFISLMQPQDGFPNPEIMLLACRCIYNLIEALPATTGTVVYCGAVPVLIEKLVNIEFADVAEQALNTLGKISTDFPGSIVRAGGLSACLQYLDFFPTSIQRTAVSTAANCSRNIPSESFPAVKEVIPNLLNVLSSSDQKVVEHGCLCISRIAESFKTQDAKLEELMTADVLRAILRLLLPGTTNLVGQNIHTQFLRVLSITARASPSLTVELFKMNVTDTLYQILTGVSPPAEENNVAQKIDSVVVMQALIHRPREQVYETLDVICELLPGLDKDAVGFLDDVPNPMGLRSKPSSSTERLELLSKCKSELRRFATVLLPTLTDAYSSTVNFNVREKVLTAQLKMLWNLDLDILEDALRAVPYASYLASILSQQDHSLLVMSALYAAELLLRRLGPIYRYQFYREGVIAEVQKLAERPVSAASSAPSGAPGSNEAPPNANVAGSSSAPAPITIPMDEDSQDDSNRSDDDDRGDHMDDDSDVSSEISEDHEPPRPIPTPSLDIRDIVTRTAKKIIEQHESEANQALRAKATGRMDDIRSLMSDIEDCYSGIRPQNGNELFHRLAQHFEGDALESITSYELLSSKLVDSLLDVFEDSGDGSSDEAKSSFLEIFMGSSSQQKVKTMSTDSPSTPFSVLVSKLQDLLSRSEHFEVITVQSSPLDSQRNNAASMLSKQIRVRLFAEGDESGVPETYRRIMVNINAIANLRALEEYLRPRMNTSERIIASGGASPSAFQRAHAAVARVSSRPEFSNRQAFTAAMAASGLDGPEAMIRRRMAEHPGIRPFDALPAFNQTPGSERPQSSGRASSRNPPFDPAPGSNRPQSPSRDSSRKPTKSKSKETHKPPKTPTEAPSASAGPSSSRRSTRKSTSKDSPAPPTSPPHSNVPKPETPKSDPQSALEVADEAPLSDDDELDEDEAIGAIVDELEEEMNEDAPDPSAVNMEVGAGGNVTAREDDGTRIDTPTQRTSTRSGIDGRPSSSTIRDMHQHLLSMNPQSTSYAAALTSTPQDWHLAFSMNGQPLSSDTTIYRAVHSNHDSSRSGPQSRSIWSDIHTIDFKLVKGPPPKQTDASDAEVSQVSEISGLPQSLEKNPETAVILRLLRILHEMNSNLDDVLSEDKSAAKISAEPASQFVNIKLTAKLNRQLEEPLIVASNCLPNWSQDLARLYPFLFPFETRHLFLQSTSFGYARSISRWQSSQSQDSNRPQRHRDRDALVPRLQRQKVRISRHRILDSAIKVLDLYGAHSSVLEVEYFDEVGTGLGPTLEFFSNVSKEFCRKKLRMWRENESEMKELFAYGRLGLFPAPMTNTDAASESGQKILNHFRILGKFVARSMMDSRIIDVPFNPIFFRINARANKVPRTLASVKAVDKDLAQSLQRLKKFITEKQRILDRSGLNQQQRLVKLSGIRVDNASIEDFCLDFTLPGYPHIELVPNGSKKNVDINNVGDYLNKVIDFTVGEGVYKQVESFKTGFSEVFSYSAVNAFTPSELVMLFGRSEEDWTLDTLMDSIKADHGYNLDSKTVRNMLHTMSDLQPQERRNFLQFVTGSPKLPIGGFKSLTPMFTVVHRPPEPGHASDDYLPSCMTCVNYLKMPDYSSLEVMKRKLNIAIKEGQSAFHLS